MNTFTLAIFLPLLTSGLRVFKWHISISLPNRIDSDSNQLLLDACAVTGVQPPWNSPKIVWTIAWNIQKNMLPILHKFDACKLQDNCVNLSVLWWKALDFEQDERVAYDMLPPLTRAVVAFPLSLLYPRLHHQNVAIRTKYLDDKLKSEISMSLSRQAVTERPDRMGKRFVQVVSLGGGFDTRALRLGSKLGVSQWMEADLPSVIAQKQLLLEKRFLERRGHGARGVRSIRDSLPILIEADLNQFRPFLSRLDSALAEVNGFIANSDSEDDSAIIIMAEAVCIYLDQEKVQEMIQSCVATARKRCRKVSFVFADRIPGIYEASCLLDAPVSVQLEHEASLAKDFFEEIGMKLETFQMKPGRARHMGVASYQN